MNLRLCQSCSRCRLVSDICQKAVAKGFRCIFSNQGYWYLDHLDVPWDEVYNTEPLNGIHDPSQQKLVIGGEVCMWGETADTSVVLQTIWPRAAAAAGKNSIRHAVSVYSIISVQVFLVLVCSVRPQSHRSEPTKLVRYSVNFVFFLKLFLKIIVFCSS